MDDDDVDTESCERGKEQEGPESPGLYCFPDSRGFLSMGGMRIVVLPHPPAPSRNRVFFLKKRGLVP
jgi:hypothetical protein